MRSSLVFGSTLLVGLGRADAASSLQLRRFGVQVLQEGGRVSKKNSTVSNSSTTSSSTVSSSATSRSSTSITFASDAMPSGHSVRFCCSTCVVG